jgi:hypothetical protein
LDQVVWLVNGCGQNKVRLRVVHPSTPHVCRFNV